MNNNFLLGNMKLTKGLAFNPISGDNRAIINFVSIDGELKSDNFSNSLYKKWTKAKDEYRSWFRSQNNFKLGSIQTIQLQSDTVIINVVVDKKIDYEVLEKSLLEIGKQAYLNKWNLHIQKTKEFSWKKLEPLLIKYLVSNGVVVYIYEEN